MSEPARPTQNAPIESFFGHLKDEIDYKKCKSFDELNDLVDNYIYYYNTRRYQWNRKK
ncbi:TPA: IS3 family transposase, partial [Candidatus Avigastranaerophilus faecigallinarum]|nr:IS3 family transposase [Candidatus Avigastranaerophilus faecigallinarum]